MKISYRHWAASACSGIYIETGIQSQLANHSASIAQYDSTDSFFNQVKKESAIWWLTGEKIKTRSV